jgi:uncharacterized YigZ family protein
MDDRYFIVARDISVETKVKGSRFIGEVCLSADVETAMGRLLAIRKREYAATHHCWAYRVGIDTEPLCKYSDDGEPGGTAGKPIFDALDGAGITNVLAVVTRYFGGTKLGTGGLVRAYGEAAKLALERAGRQERFLTDRFALHMTFPRYNVVQQLINRLGATVVDSQFSDSVDLAVTIRKSLAGQFAREFVEVTQGKAQIEEIRSDTQH